MSIMRNLISGLRALFHKEEMEQEMDEELRGFLDAAVKEKMRSGISHDEALRAARVEMGSVDGVKEEIRRSGWESTLEALWQDLRYGVRQLHRNPGFTAVAVLTLALGIGVNAAMFSIINATLLTPLPYRNADRLVWLGTRFPGFNHPIPLSGPDFLDWNSQNHVFDYIAAIQSDGFTLTGRGEPEVLPGSLVSTNFFNLFDEKPELGRGFVEGEDQPGHNHVVVLSYDLWKTRFGFSPNVLGSNLTLEGESYTIVGVAPQGFAYPRGMLFWSPIVFDVKHHPRGNHYLQGIARLKPRVTLTQAQADMDTIASRIAAEYPEQNKGVGVDLILLKQRLVQFIRPALLVLFGAVGFVLLIACANVANLSVAQATKRRKEITLRAALGARGFRLIRQFLTESLLLSFLAGGLAVLVATWSLALLRALKPDNIPDVNKIHLDLHVLGFLLAISLLVGIAAGLAPALHASRLHLSESLKESGGAAIGGTSGGSLRSVLVVAEIALCLVLLVGAGLLIRSFARLLSIDPGYDPKNLLTFQIGLPDSKYPKNSQVMGFFREALDRIGTCPGVQSVAISNTMPPFGTEMDGPFYVEGHEPKNSDVAPDAIYDPISPGYFQTMKTPLIAGRYFTEFDNNEKSRALIINETLAREFLGGPGAVGKRIKAVAYGAKDWWEVVGVVADERFFGWDNDVGPVLYYPYGELPQRGMTFVVRTKIDPMHVSSAVRQGIWSIDKGLPFTEVRTMDQRLSQSFSERRFHMILLGFFAGLALILSVVGIYGVMSYSVNQRTHEIGLRMALGAERDDVLRMVLKRGLVLTLMGAGSGLAGAFALTRFLVSMLYGVHPTDVVTFAAVSLLLTAIALLACYIPARRATKVDPMVALRYE
ncbi:MAG: ADOP family duplicated permease [Terriglobia bacterium]